MTPNRSPARGRNDANSRTVVARPSPRFSLDRLERRDPELFAMKVEQLGISPDKTVAKMTRDEMRALSVALESGHNCARRNQDQT